MSAPQDLSEFERRQNTLMQLRNRKIRQDYFSDVIDTTPDDSPRRVLMDDLLLKDTDCFADMWLKSELLKEVIDDDAPVFLPNYDDIPVTVKDKPHVHLYFIEKKGTAILARRKRAEALISFRLVDKTISTITQSDLNELKREIGLAFPSSYQLKKGRFKYSYRDKANGYELILTLLNETEAREVITKVLSIRDKTPDFEDFLKTSTSEKNFNARKTVMILNELEKLPLERPIADCYFQKAIITFGKLKKVTLLQRAV
jgi:hypothetical protein